jgi:hypothetical protein
MFSKKFIRPVKFTLLLFITNNNMALEKNCDMILTNHSNTMFYLCSAIILGQLKLTLSEIRHALYMLDEEVLTPELLRQLLSYAPNKQEVRNLATFHT